MATTTEDHSKELARALADAEAHLERVTRELETAKATHRLAVLAVSVLRDALNQGRDDG